MAMRNCAVCETWVSSTEHHVCPLLPLAPSNGERVEVEWSGQTVELIYLGGLWQTGYVPELTEHEVRLRKYYKETDGKVKGGADKLYKTIRYNDQIPVFLIKDPDRPVR